MSDDHLTPDQVHAALRRLPDNDSLRLRVIAAWDARQVLHLTTAEYARLTNEHNGPCGESTEKVD